MTEKLLISQDDVRKFFTFAEVEDERFDPHVMRAQELDLKPLLNEALYYDFLSKHDSTGDPMYDEYQTLLNGGTFTYAGQTIEYAGIKPMLACYTMARFLPHAQINVTAFGVVSKVNDRSTPVEQTNISYLVKQILSDAVAYQNQVRRFLEQNSATYPLYSTMPDTNSRTGGLRMFRAGEGRAANRDQKHFGWYNGVYYP